ncbi:hypothetical protein AGLY_013895 [Aphis glycines]|uniref:Uncharacterized protein n=1 Tax=Aphis glycines TaxID=307491 RepID=A0A6G0T5E2_APHGL|nr:hypothetical protein AGLY_013895 [Aphis glycines]
MCCLCVTNVRQTNLSSADINFMLIAFIDILIFKKVTRILNLIIVKSIKLIPLNANLLFYICKILTTNLLYYHHGEIIYTIMKCTILNIYLCYTCNHNNFFLNILIAKLTAIPHIKICEISTKFFFFLLAVKSIYQTCCSYMSNKFELKRNVRTVALMVCRHNGQSSRLEAQVMHATKWAQDRLELTLSAINADSFVSKVTFSFSFSFSFSSSGSDNSDTSSASTSESQSLELEEAEIRSLDSSETSSSRGILIPSMGSGSSLRRICSRVNKKMNFDLGGSSIRSLICRSVVSLVLIEELILFEATVWKPFSMFNPCIIIYLPILKTSITNPAAAKLFGVMINDTGQPVNVPSLLLSFFKSIDCDNSISVNKSFGSASY